MAFLTYLSEVQKGDLIHFRSEVNDVSQVLPITEEFYVKVIEPLKKKQTNGGKESHHLPTSLVQIQKPDGFALPTIIEVSRDGRTDIVGTTKFTESSALKVKGSEEDGYDFFVT